MSESNGTSASGIPAVLMLSDGSVFEGVGAGAEGMSAGEAGADYASFGPIGATTLGDGSQVDFDLFEWWSEVIEVPIIAEGALTAELVAKFGPVTDFFAVGEEIWGAEDPLAALKALLAPLG